MNKKCLTKHLLVYEIRNITGNVVMVLFGVFLPLIMSILLANGKGMQVPESLQMDFRTLIFLCMMMLIPMLTTFVGYAAAYSKEMENNILLRFDLFGIRKHNVLAAKLLANLLFLLALTAIYFAVGLSLIKIHTPPAEAVLLVIFVVILLGALFLVIAHLIANLTGKFSYTYAITMFLFFTFMTLSGMMGVQVSDFPPVIQKIAKLLPMTYMGTFSDFLKVWKGESYNPVNFILSFVFLAAVAAALFLINFWKNRRRKKAIF